MWQSTAMTLLVAAKSSEGLLFWGDGQGAFDVASDPFRAYSPGPLENLCKVMPTSMPGLMWGFAGSSAIGLEVARQIEGVVFESWDDAKPGLEAVAVSVIRNARRNVKDVGHDPDYAGLETWCLFAGTIANEIMMLRITAQAVGEWVNTLAVEGHGANQFRLLWTVYRDLQPLDNLLDPDRFLDFVEAFCNRSVGLHSPGQLWLLSNDRWSQYATGHFDREGPA